MLLPCISAVGRTGREFFSGLHENDASAGNTGRRGKPGGAWLSVDSAIQSHSWMAEPAIRQSPAQQRCRTSMTAIIVITRSVTAEVAAAWGPNWIA